MRRLFIIVFSLLFIVHIMAGVKLDGTDDIVDMGADSNLFISPPLTVGCMFNASYSGGYLIACGTDKYNRWGILISDDSTVSVFNDLNNAGKTITTNTKVVGNGWHTVIVTINGSNGTKIYVDGMLDGSDVASNSLLGFDECYTSGSCKFLLGAIMNLSYTDLINFSSAEITDVFLSASNWNSNMIDSFANGDVKRVPLQDESLVEYWALDDLSDGVSYDGITVFGCKNKYNGTGDDGANNSGLLATDEKIGY